MWASVTAPVDEHAKTVVEWAQEAIASASKARKDEEQVKELAQKASGQMSTVLAEVGEAKENMERALDMERKIRVLKDHLWSGAKKRALKEVPKMLSKLREKAKKKAEKEAKKKAKTFKKEMEDKGKIESAKAAKVY